MIRRRWIAVFLLGPALASLAAADARPESGTVLKTLRDFEEGKVGEEWPAFVHWGWSAEEKAKAGQFSGLEIVGGTPFGQKCLKLAVNASMPKGPESYRMVPLGVDYLPPECDAVRMRVKALRGKLKLTVGGPTVYFGHSDVLARPVELDAAGYGDWSTVEWSLNEALTRNYRRSQWSHTSPVIYYTRWIQEPMAINVLAGSDGEVLIDEVQLVGHRDGRPYPTFKDDQVQTVRRAADFERDSSMQQAFTILTSSTDQPDFSRSAYLLRPSWAPPRLKRVAGEKAQALETVMTGTEEVCFAGVKLAGATGSNAISLRMMAENAGRSEVVLDFVAYAAPVGGGESFPWDGLRPPVSWRERPELSFTYYLTAKNEQLKGASFAMYHARRPVRSGEWSTVVVPLADFVCLYGQGSMTEAFQKQRPLEGGNVFALTYLSYFGQRSRPTRMLLEEISFVTVPGRPEELRSFYQVGPNQKQ